MIVHRILLAFEEFHRNFHVLFRIVSKTGKVHREVTNRNHNYRHRIDRLQRTKDFIRRRRGKQQQVHLNDFVEDL